MNVEYTIDQMLGNEMKKIKDGEGIKKCWEGVRFLKCVLREGLTEMALEQLFKRSRCMACRQMSGGRAFRQRQQQAPNPLDRNKSFQRTRCCEYRGEEDRSKG